jgi:tRNA threonylcarbamoyladenosine biosynthesis protein TsaB
MITLAIDTCDRDGSVAVRLNGRSVGVRLHKDEDYSSWLIPAVESSLAEAGRLHQELDLLAVATGPGSFTGVRVGLCAVKAWAEVHGTRVVGVSRLESMARQAATAGWVVASYDAHRGQLFAGLYRRDGTNWKVVDQEMVVAPEVFLALVKEKTRGEAVQWIALQPELISTLSGWKSQQASGSSVTMVKAGVASLIGELAEEKAARGEFTDVLQLDANYVRRSDAEIYWKGPAHRGG